MLFRYHALVFLLLIGFSTQSKAQEVEEGVSFRFLIPDYQGLITGDYGAAFSDEDNDDFIPNGVELGYYRGLNDAITLGIPFRIGTINFPNSETNASDYTKQVFLNVGVQGIYKFANGSLLKKDIAFSPYVLAGLGATYLSKQENKFTYDVPVGLGVNWRMNDVVNMQAQSEFHLSASNHLMHSVGLYFNVGEAAEKPAPKVLIEAKPVVEVPKPKPVAADKDGDGVLDANDKCPDVAGLSKFGGCPDSDGDGVQDSKDACPSVAGLAKLGGCPDSDGDGVQDNKDGCPTKKGLAQFNGCPDTDNDGIQDSKDKCPTTAGVAANNGCPQVKEEEKKILEFAKRGVKFRTGKNDLTTASYQILDDVAQILVNNPDYRLKISGYTDSKGKDATNLALSQKRAKACFDYITKKGVAPTRMTHEGYGEANPIADNATATGRSQNRRVEFEIFFAGQ